MHFEQFQNLPENIGISVVVIALLWLVYRLMFRQTKRPKQQSIAKCLFWIIVTGVSIVTVTFTSVFGIFAVIYGSRYLCKLFFGRVEVPIPHPATSSMFWSVAINASLLLIVMTVFDFSLLAPFSRYL